MNKHQWSYDIALRSENETKKDLAVLATKINIIISDHDFDKNEEKIVFNEIIKLQNEEEASPAQIITALGSVRGIKDKVRQRIEQFLNGGNNVTENEENEREKQSGKLLGNSSNKSNKIIIYTTSLGIVRRTKGDCNYLMSVFRSMMLKTEERDIVSQYYHDEFKNLFPNSLPPQVVINSFPVGGRKEIENLIETGEINLLTKDIEKVQYSSVKCLKCSGYGYLPCPICLGSCRSRIIRIGKTREVNNLKCTQCKEGMVRCMDCINMISY